MSCKNCIHCSACMHTRTATLDPYQSRPTNKDTRECSDCHSCYVQEIRHAKWVHYGEDVHCSNCEQVSDDIYYEGDMDSGYYTVLPHYCSNCGSKMDLEEKENEH